LVIVVDSISFQLPIAQLPISVEEEGVRARLELELAASGRDQVVDEVEVVADAAKAVLVTVVGA